MSGLFLIYIKDIDLNILGEILKFADDTNAVVLEEEDGEMLQPNPDRLKYWSNQWQMTFNIEKCKVIHIVNTHWEEKS